MTRLVPGAQDRYARRSRRRLPAPETELLTSLQKPVPRSASVVACLALGLVCLLLVGESLLPGSVLLPLLPDDFPDLAAGEDPETLVHHPAPNWTMSDVLHLLVPGYATTREALARGELPLWDPSQALGVPHIDEIHYGVFYPPAWLPVLLGWRGLGLEALLHLLVAGLGTWLYLGALGRSPPARVFGAIAFLAGAWFTARLHNGSAAGAAAWMPWMLYGLERGARVGGGRGYAVAAVALALSWLAGFPQVTVLALCAAGVLEFGRLLTAHRRGRTALRLGLPALGTVLLGCVLAAPQLVPTVEYMLGSSSRADLRPAELAAECLEWPLLEHLLVPDYYAAANTTGFHPLALGALEQAANPVAVNRPEVSMAVGTLGLLLALVAMLHGRRWATRTWTLLVLLCFGLLLSRAAFTAAATVVPALRLGSPKRLLLLTSFGLAVLAAGGFDLIRARSMRVAATAWLLALAAVAGTCLLLLSVPGTSEPGSIDAWALRLAKQLGMQGGDVDAVYAIVPVANFVAASEAAFSGSVLALLTALAGVFLFRPRALPTQEGWTTHAARRPVLLCALGALELVLVARPLLRPAPIEAVTSSPGRIDRMNVPALVSALRGLSDDPVVPPRIGRVGNDPSWLRPDFPSLFGLHDVQAFAPMVPRRMTELFAATTPEVPINGSTLGGFAAASLTSPLLDMLSVSAVLTHDEGLLPSGFEELERVGPVRVLRNEEALPRAWFVAAPGVECVGRPEEALARLARPDFDPRSTAVFEEPVAMPDVPDAGKPREVEVTAYRPGAMTVAIGAGRPGVLVVSEGWDARWKVRISHGGGAAERFPPVLCCDHALMAVPVRDPTAGTVTLAFGRGSLDWAALVGGAGALAVLVLLLRPGREPEGA